MIDVDRARTETPGTRHCVHLNNCGAALMPQPVIDAVTGHIDLEARIGGYEAARCATQALDHTYRAVARLINARVEEIALVENATRGWDMVFYALPLAAGDRILTSTAEYASNYIAFLQVARRTGAVIEVVPDDEAGSLDITALERMIDRQVKLIAVTHVPTNGGVVNPAREIGRIARAHGIPFMLDACQSIGQMPVDVEDLGIDFLSATSRKYLRGPRGVGFVYIRRQWIETLTPPFLDVHAATWTDVDEYDIRPDARRFENWECDVAARLGFGVAVDYALGWGLSAIEERVTELAGGFRRRLAAHPALTVRDRGARRCGIVSFTSSAHSSENIVAALAEQRINVSVSYAPSTLLDMRGRDLSSVVRAGVHYYNTVDEIDACCQTLERMT